MPNAPVQMTRAEYQAKYGVAPNVPSVNQSSEVPQAPQGQPVSMTRAEYQAKYGVAPNIPQQSQDTGQDLSNTFSTPLTNIASGNSEANVQHAIGAGKGILQTVRDVSGVDTNPVVKGMLTNAPEFAKAVESEKQLIAPSNLEQAKGSAETQLGAGLVPVGQGAKAVSTIKNLAGEALTGSKDAVLTAVSPRLTPSVAAETATKTTGILKQIVPQASNQLKKVADAVRSIFNPKATWSANAEATSKAIGTEANKLESAIDSVNHPIVIKELGSRLMKAEEPISLKGTSFEKQITPLKNAAVKLTQEAGGTVKGAFQALRKFDDYVDKTWPTLWDRENAPMRNAVTAIRNEWKNFIEENLPADNFYKKSLENQTLLFDARDAFKEKAALGELQRQGEIGTNVFQRFPINHPTAAKAIKYGSGIIGTSLLGGEVAGQVINQK